MSGEARQAGAERLRFVTHVCFHGIGRPRRALEPGEATYWVERAPFLELLDELAGRPDIAVSFDDGNASDVDIALPALLERSLSASFFVVAGRLGQPGSLSVAALGELLAGGMTIGSHGLHHRPWPGLAGAELDDELVGARTVLQEAIGRPVLDAALPLGRYDRAVLARLRRLGYRRVFTSDRRPARPGRWLQPRYSIRATDRVATLRGDILQPTPALRRWNGELRQLAKSLR
jgi:peptidoglycan/xylan/chitin deacetylase (PgdA/CDA1 family)